MDSDSTSPGMEEEAGISRRRILSGLGFTLGGTLGGFFVLSIVGYLIRPLWHKSTPVWRQVGAADSFTIGNTVKVTFTNASPLPWGGGASQSAAWLRRLDKDTFMAFKINCTHLGCPVRWVPGADLFMCPCHGSVFYKDGTVAAGPASGPLQKYDVRLRNGQVEIKTGPIPIVTIT